MFFVLPVIQGCASILFVKLAFLFSEMTFMNFLSAHILFSTHFPSSQPMTLPYALNSTENHDLGAPFLLIDQPMHGCLCALFFLYKLEMLPHLKEVSLCYLSSCFSPALSILLLSPGFKYTDKFISSVQTSPLSSRLVINLHTWYSTWMCYKHLKLNTFKVDPRFILPLQIYSSPSLPHAVNGSTTH